MTIQQRLFDGYSVPHERGTLGAFEIEDEDVEHFRADDVLVLVVTATVAGGSFKHDSSGDWVRTNKLATHEVRVADGVMKEEIVEFYNLGGDHLQFSNGSAARGSSPVASTHVDPTAGLPPVDLADDDGIQNDDDDDGDEGGDEDEDMHAALTSNGSGPANGVGAATHDPALAAFLDEG
jgi:hypothetical protein